jgi:hypothetical protein
MRTFAQRQNRTQPVSSSLARSKTAAPRPPRRADPILHLQHTIGNQAVQRLLQRDKPDSLEVLSRTTAVTQLKVNEPGDTYEQEADRIAEQVMEPPSHRDLSGTPPRIQGVSGQPAGQMDAAPASVDHALASPGRPLEPALRQEMEQRFDQDFSGVRVHTGALAEQSARDVMARAYTVGNDIVFGAGGFASGAQEGRRLIAHELTHVVQQRQRTSSVLQRAALQNYNDSDKKHEPSKLTDAQIEATNEFKSYTDPKLVWQWQYHVTRAEALLACRLILRHMREGGRVNWTTDAVGFMNLARRQLGTLKATEKLVGKLEWTQATEDQFRDPAAAQSDLSKWLLASGPEPTDLSKMNCWEMILFGAFRGNVASKDRLRNMYRDAARRGNPPVEIENQLCGVSSVTFNPKDPNSPEPLPGDIIIFDVIENHAAIALGTTAIGGDHWVISLHASPAAPRNQVEIVTLEQLLTDTSLPIGKLCPARW